MTLALIEGVDGWLIGDDGADRLCECTRAGLKDAKIFRMSHVSDPKPSERARATKTSPKTAVALVSPVRDGVREESVVGVGKLQPAGLGPPGQCQCSAFATVRGRGPPPPCWCARVT